MVCFEFAEPVHPKQAPAEINDKLRNSYVIEASRPFARFFGYQYREEIIGKSLNDLFPSELPNT